MNRIKIETMVGLFLLVGLASFAVLAVQLGGVGGLDNDHYTLEARFTSSSGLKVGSDVEVAGVVVGKVKRIRLDPEAFESVVEVSLPKSVRLQEDAIASVRSTGLIGGKFIKISPGGADELLEPGDEITETESAVNLEELIGKYMFQNDSGE